MSLLVVLRETSVEVTGSRSPAAEALASAADQGFGAPESFHWGTGTAWLFPTPGNSRGSGAWVREGDRFALSVGALHWNGLTGTAALRRLMAHEGSIESLPVAAISGSFVALLGRPDGVWLFNDALGILKSYEVAGGAVISTSQLVCRATIETPTVDRFAAQEYILFGGNHGSRTPIDGIRVVDPTAARDLIGGRSVQIHAPAQFSLHARPASVATAVEAVCEAIASEFRGVAAAFGSNIGMALSGGFDSRLLLAALDHVGVQPHLFVYGRPADEDVVVAKAVARGLGMPIETIDKSALDAERAPLSTSLLASNLRFFDGTPGDGIFDRGSDRATRLKQIEGGRLNLNGGGGEILRNFFYLPDRPYSAADLFAAFYSGWFDDVFLDRDERVALAENMQDAILEALGIDHGSKKSRTQPLRRIEVELVYGLVRLRYWMGRNNAIAARHGAFMTPLVTPVLVTLAAAIPIAWKEYGRLEAQVIAALSPRVAAGLSAYGFAFNEGPPWSYRLRASMNLHRPLALRRRSLSLQRRLGRIQPVTAPQEWIDALGELPRTDLLNPHAFSHADQMNRLLTLQAMLSPMGRSAGK